MNDVCDRVHESVEVARLDAAKFAIAQFGNPDLQGDKPRVYDAAIAYIERALHIDPDPLPKEPAGQ